MKNITEILDFIAAGGATKRYHTITTIQTDTVAAHSFRVAQITKLITEEEGLLGAALAHDLAEACLGTDMPSPTKRKLGEDAINALCGMEEEVLCDYGFEAAVELQAVEARVLKFADLLDGMVFCLSERRLGNAGISEVFKRYRDYAATILSEMRADDASPKDYAFRASALFSHLCSAWNACIHRQGVADLGVSPNM